MEGTPVPRNALLDELLEEELSFEATTRDGLSSHLPMAVLAKGALGATRDELLTFAKRYQRRLVPRGTPEEELTATTWHSAIGVHGSYDDLSVYFERAVADHGVEATLRSHLPHAIDGIQGAAYHGALRLAYALEDGSPSRVASGLAYLVENAVPLTPVHSPSRTNRTLRDAVDALARAARANPLARLGLISDEMRAAVAQPWFADALAGVEPTEASPERLREVSLHLFATTGDFASLHTVTGSEALAALRPYVEEQERFDWASLIGVAAAYVCVGAPTLASPTQLEEYENRPRPTVDEIRDAGATSGDEHVAKLVYTGLRLYHATTDPLYLFVAARKAKLIA